MRSPPDFQSDQYPANSFPAGLKAFVLPTRESSRSSHSTR
jgi:hypothetical protein